MAKNYEPTIIPRKKSSQGREWFELIDNLNHASVKNRKHWQEEGVKTLGGWIVMTPKGGYLHSTFSVNRRAAQKKCLEPPFHRFNGIIPCLWSEWEKVGYRVVKVEMKVKP